MQGQHVDRPVSSSTFSEEVYGWAGKWSLNKPCRQLHVDGDENPWQKPYSLHLFAGNMVGFLELEDALTIFWELCWDIIQSFFLSFKKIAVLYWGTYRGWWTGGKQSWSLAEVPWFSAVPVKRQSGMVGRLEHVWLWGGFLRGERSLRVDTLNLHCSLGWCTRPDACGEMPIKV